ncbi:MAG: DUF3606 domain-containing protein [Pseudomonadota bacterium]
MTHVRERSRADKNLGVEEDWGARFGVSPNALREAVHAVGNDVARIEIYLRVLSARQAPKRHRVELRLDGPVKQVPALVTQPTPE